MNASIDYYALLGLTSAASEEDIRRAYRKRILEVHLDKLAPGEDSELCYRTIEAYRVLSNKATRTKYDILRDTELNRQPTDEELRRKYAEHFSGANGSATSASVCDISKLRALYAAERRAALAERARNSQNVAGAICYDVGQEQFSRRVAQRISEWEDEYEKLRFNDNYFESLSQVFGRVLEKHQPINGERPATTVTNSGRGPSSWKCRLCEASFLSETHHWNTVLAPYVTFLSEEAQESPKSKAKTLEEFFLHHVGDLYAFKPRYLPPKPSGIWGESKIWAKFPRLHRRIAAALDHLRADVGDLKRNYKFIPRTRGLTSEESEIVIWTLRNQNSQEKLLDKASALLAVNQMDSLFAMACVMKRVDKLDIPALITEAFTGVQLELAMFWTMLGNLLGEGEERGIPDWFDLGVRIHNECDPLLAHFCFLIGGYDMGDIADTFAEKGNLYAAAEWMLNSPTADAMLSKGDVSTESGLQPDFYRVVYNSSETKHVLRTLTSNSQTPAAMSALLQKLIEHMTKLTPNSATVLEGIRLIVTQYPREAIECHELHRTVIRILKKSCRSFDQVRTIVAAYHFLPPSEFDEMFIRLESRRLMRSKLDSCVRTCDYEAITEALLHLEKRNLPAAESLLQDYTGDTNGGTPGVLNEAMRLLIQGTIHRVNCNWIGSMSAYQEAMLSTPECMYRLVPCVSKLTQDEFFHESVLAKVQLEVKQLKEFFDYGEYVEIDSTVDSLVVSDPVPGQDFGYEEKTSRLQAVEPQQKPVVDNPDALPPPVETNTPLVTLTKNEKAIEQGLGATTGAADMALNAAFGYMDLIKALPPKNQNGPLVMAASHLLRAMEAVEEPRKLFAYRNCVQMMAEQLFKLESGGSVGVQSCLSHKHMFSILLMANQKLSQALQEEQERKLLEEGSSNDSVSNSEDESNDVRAHTLQKSPSQLISGSNSKLISDFLTNIVQFPKIEPLINVPTLNCSDLQYVETVWTQFMVQFCRDKVSQSAKNTLATNISNVPSSGSAHLQAYTLFNEVRQGRSDLMDFDSAKEKAMQNFLASKQGWGERHVEKLLQWAPGRFTPEGWTDVLNVQLQFESSEPEMVFRSIDGFQIDYESCAIGFLVTRPDLELAPPLICERDLIEIFEKGFDEVYLSFEDPRGHPCQEVKLSRQLRGSELEATALRVAMLVNYFASGVEVNVSSPFYIRNAQLGLMSRLPEHLQFFCRSLRQRGHTHTRTDSPGFKFWLRFTEAYYEDESNDSIYSYKVGNVQAELVPATVEGEESLSSPALMSFAQDFTRSYDEIGLYYPELTRLKELYKIGLMHRKLRQILIENNTLISQNGKSEEEIFRLGQLCFSIRKLGVTEGECEPDECNENGADAKNNTTSIWIPSVGCHNLWSGGDDAVGGGLCWSFEKEPIFGPVCSPLLGSGTPQDVVPALRFFLSPDKVETDVTVELKGQKSHQFTNIIKEAVASNSDVSWWTQKAKDAGSTGSRSDSECTTPTPSLAGQLEADGRICPESCSWKLIQSTEELYYKGALIYKRLAAAGAGSKVGIDADTTSTTSSDLQDFDPRANLRRNRRSASSDSQSTSSESESSDMTEEDDSDENMERCSATLKLNQQQFISDFSEKYSCSTVQITPAPTLVKEFCNHFDNQERTPVEVFANSESVDQEAFLANFSRKYFAMKHPKLLQQPNPTPTSKPKGIGNLSCYSICDMESNFWRVFHIVIDKTKDCYACFEDDHNRNGKQESSSCDSTSESTSGDTSSSDSDSETDTDSKSAGRQRHQHRKCSKKKTRTAVNKYYKLFYGDKEQNSNHNAEDEAHTGENNEEDNSESDFESQSISSSTTSSLTSEDSSTPPEKEGVGVSNEEFLIQSGVYRIGKAYTDPHHGPLTMELKLIQPSTPEYDPDGNSIPGTPAALNPKFDRFFIHGMNSNHVNALTRSNSMYIPRLNLSNSFSSSSIAFTGLARSNSTYSARFNSLSRSASTSAAAYSAAFIFASVGVGTGGGDDSVDGDNTPTPTPLELEHVSVILPSNLRKRLSSSTDRTMYVN